MFIIFVWWWQEFLFKQLQCDAVRTALTCSTSVKCSCVVEQALMLVKRDCRQSVVIMACVYKYYFMPMHFLNLIFNVFCEAWNTKEQLASAYQLGRSETTAAMNLMTKTAPAIKVKLQELVRLGRVVF